MLSDLQKNIDDRMWTNVAYGKKQKQILDFTTILALMIILIVYNY